MKFPLFARFLALSGALKATNLTTHTSTAECEVDVCMGGINSFPVMAPISAPLFGLHILKGIFSLKNGTKIVLLIMRTSPFKGTCLFIYSVEDSFALYGPHLRCYKPVRT